MIKCLHRYRTTGSVWVPCHLYTIFQDKNGLYVQYICTFIFDLFMSLLLFLGSVSTRHKWWRTNVSIPFFFIIRNIGWNRMRTYLHCTRCAIFRKCFSLFFFGSIISVPTQKEIQVDVCVYVKCIACTGTQYTEVTLWRMKIKWMRRWFGKFICFALFYYILFFAFRAYTSYTLYHSLQNLPNHHSFKIINHHHKFLPNSNRIIICVVVMYLRR